MEKAIAGKALDKKELDSLKAATPAPIVVFSQVRVSLLQFCKSAIKDLEAAKNAVASEGPDCECINKNQKGPDCECINKAPVVLAKTEAKGPDCECINKNQKVPDCECINKAPVVLAKTEKKGPDCECINKNPKVLAKTEKKGPDCECINKNQ